MDNTKAEFLGLLAGDKNLDLRKVTQKLKTPLATLKRWKQETRVEKTTRDLEALVEAEPEELEKALNLVDPKAMTVASVAEALVIDPETNEVLPETELIEVTEKRQIETELAKAREKERLAIFKNQVNIKKPIKWPMVSILVLKSSKSL